MKEKLIYERPVIVKNQSGFMNKFGTQTVTQPLENIENIKVSALVEKYGSPLFVLSEKKIRSNQKNLYRTFKNRYPKVQFAWSYKTNILSAVCKTFHQEGSWAEVVSEYEYTKARSLGVLGENIIFNGPHKPDSALLRAAKENAAIHIDNFDELYRLIEIAEFNKLKPRVAIRINLDTGIYPKWDRFGFNYENGEAWLALKRIMTDKNLNLVGLHTHIGTYMMAVEPYRFAVNALIELAKRIKNSFDHTIDYIDLGGGFPSNNTLIGQYLTADQILPSVEQFADAITESLLMADFAQNEVPTLILETGRALVDDAGYLIATVIASKRLSSGKRALIIDAGVNLLFTSFWYKHKISVTHNHYESTEEAALYGPLCMNIDCIRDSINLPLLKHGDNLVIHNVGAYNMTQWLQFIELRPNVVMIMEDGSTEVIRKAETLEDLTSNERIPEKLR